MSKNIPFVMARQICAIVENNSIKNKHLNELRTNFKTYGFPEKIIEIQIQLKSRKKYFDNQKSLTIITI